MGLVSFLKRGRKMAKLKNFFNNFKIGGWLFVTLSLIYFEIITKLLTCDVFFNTGLIFMPVFSLCFGLILNIPTIYMSNKASKIYTSVVLIVIAVIHITQIVYFSVFNKYLVFYSLTAGGVGNVLEGGIIITTLKSILGGVPAMLAFSVPIVLSFIFGGKKIVFRRSGWVSLVLVLVPAVCLYFGATAIASSDKDLNIIQSGLFDPNLAVKEFGLIRTELLDIKYNLFGVEPSPRSRKAASFSSDGRLDGRAYAYFRS